MSLDESRTFRPDFAGIRVEAGRISPDRAFPTHGARHVWMPVAALRQEFFGRLS